jgi:RHS repeat-associated protein
MYNSSGLFERALIRDMGVARSVNCDPTAPIDPTSVRMWPVEYNSYSVGGRVILRPDGRKELVVTNHLGSTVAVVEVSTHTAPVVGQQHTTAYGQPITVKGAVDADRARTGYIGRETDAEHNLGAFGARLYSSEYGRFLAVDKLWEKYRSLQPYQYAANSPVMAVDRNGKEIVPVNLTEEEKASVNRLIEWIRSKNDPQLNAILSYALSSESTIHLYSMPPERAYGDLTFSRFNHPDGLEDRFYDQPGRIGLTLQNPMMASQGQADVMIRSDVAGSVTDLLFVVLLDEFHHVMSDGIDVGAETRDHQSLFTHLLMLHDRGIVTLSKSMYTELLEQIKVTQPHEIEPQQPEIVPAKGGDNE